METIKELRLKCKQLNIKGYSKKRKEDLIAHIQNATIKEEISNYPIEEAFTLVFSLLSMNTLIDYYMNPPFPDFDKFAWNELKKRKKERF